MGEVLENKNNFTSIAELLAEILLSSKKTRQNDKIACKKEALQTEYFFCTFALQLKD
jgi:hypothetical protein